MLWRFSWLLQLRFNYFLTRYWRGLQISAIPVDQFHSLSLPLSISTEFSSFRVETEKIWSHQSSLIFHGSAAYKTNNCTQPNPKNRPRIRRQKNRAHSLSARSTRCNIIHKLFDSWKFNGYNHTKNLLRRTLRFESVSWPINKWPLLRFLHVWKIMF